MSSYKTALRIDWLRWTVGEHVGQSNAVPALECFDPDPRELKSLPYYSQARKMVVGRMDWAPDRPSQGTMVTLTGSDLKALRSKKQPLGTILQHIASVKGRVTRIDVALDVFDSGITPDDLAAMDDRGEIKTPSKKRLRWEGKENNESTGVTVQWGTRQSERLLRAYEKGKEQNTKQDVLRIEIEIHGRKATSLVNAMLKYGIRDAGIAAIAKFFEGSSAEFVRDILSDRNESVDIEPIGRKETDRYRWVVNVALPAVLEEIRKGDADIEAIIRREVYGDITKG